MELEGHHSRKYQVVYLGKALRYFIENAKIELYYKDTAIINIMDYLPVLKSGFAFRNTLYLILLIYNNINYGVHRNGIIPDRLFKEAFGSNISSEYYQFRWLQIESDDMVSCDAITMRQALSENIILRPLNTFDVIKLNDHSFTKDKFDDFFLKDIVDYNCYSLDYLDGRDEILGNQQLLDDIRIESDLLHDIHEIIMNHFIVFHRQINFVDFIGIATQIKITTMMQYFVSDPWVRLLVAIISRNTKLITVLLNIDDPRIHNNLAYSLALEINDPNIINMIKDNIIKRRLLDKRVFESRLEPIIGKSDVPETLTRSFRY